ncbi:MAG: pirin family protein [Saprospiraceae bacterium]|nr:pirin family protein [Saprospiraceae bacterium]
MKTTFYSADSRGKMDFGWLKANYSFSFANYYNPERIHFGKLRVLNDDSIAGGMGFGKHPHENMEIITIPLKGSLKHKDSTGNSGIIGPNEVQIMSAGKGIEHSEMNHLKNDVTKLLQIWIFPKEYDIEPRYEQQYFEPEHRKNTWQPVVSNRHMGAMNINQDAVLSLTTLEKGKSLDYTINYEGNGVFFYVINGKVNLNGELLAERDAMGVEEIENTTFTAEEDTYLLAIEVPMN